MNGLPSLLVYRCVSERVSLSNIEDKCYRFLKSVRFVNNCPFVYLFNIQVLYFMINHDFSSFDDYVCCCTILDFVTQLVFFCVFSLTTC